MKTDYRARCLQSLFCILAVPGFLFLAIEAEAEELPIRTLGNEVIRADHADPHILRRGNDYFLGGTIWDMTEGGFLRISHSTDLLHWRLLTFVFDFRDRPEWIDADTPDVWAGHCLYNQETQLYHYYYSAMPKDAQPGYSGHAIAVATAPSIVGPWTDRGPIFRGGGLNGKALGNGGVIDAYLYSENGKTYMFCQEELHGRWLLSVELTEDLLAIKPETLHEVRKTPDEWTTWENGVAEGQAVVKRGDEYVMIFSGNNYSYGANYAVGILKAQDITGPWVPYEANPIFGSDEFMNAPGLLKSIFQTDDGSWWTYYHAYANERGSSVSRTVFLDQVEWTANNVPHMKGLRCFTETRPTDAPNNLLVFGNFACGTKNARPWETSSTVAIRKDKQTGRGFVAEFSQDDSNEEAILKQRVGYLHNGDYRITASFSGKANPRLKITVCTLSGKVLANTVLANPADGIEGFVFTKTGGMPEDLMISIEGNFTNSSGNVLLHSIRMQEVFTRELQAEYGTKSGALASRSHEEARAGFYISAMQSPGQEVHFPIAKAPRDGQYTATLRYTAMTDRQSSLNVYVNSEYAGALVLAPTNTGTSFREVSFPIDLLRGDNLIALKYEPENKGSIGVDALCLDSQTKGKALARLVKHPMDRMIESFSRDYYKTENNWAVKGCNERGLFDLELLPSLFYVCPDDFWCRGNLCWVCPGMKNDIAISWTAPEAGKASYSARIRLPHRPESDGIRVRVMRNDKQVFPANGWKVLDHSAKAVNEAVAFETEIDKGDKLYLQLNCNGNNGFDITRVDPYIAVYQ